jgi:hypothetical protein
MSAAVASQVTVQHHAVDMFGVFLGKRRIGYIRLYQPGGPPPINWLPKSVGGIDIDVTTRIAILEKVVELMGVEWQKHEAELKKLRELENGLVAVETGEAPAAEAPAEEPAAKKPKK